MKRLRAGKFRKYFGSYRAAQLILVSPLVLLWIGFFEFYRTRSMSFLKSFFPAEWWTPILLLGLPAAAFIYTLYRMYRRSPEKLAWALDILVCLFVGCSMYILVGQVFSL